MRGAIVVLSLFVVAACSSLVPRGSPSPFTPTVSPSPVPASASPTPAPSPSPVSVPSHGPTAGAGFYLRAAYVQALPPRGTFAWLPVLTIANGSVLDGNVAIPAIYPGPLMIVPASRWI